MKPDTSTWQGFTIGDLFDEFKRGKANQTKLEDGHGLFYVGAKRDDNGVMRRCAYDKTLVSPGNCIVFISNGQGSVGYANYMDVEFVASTDLILGYADWLNPAIGLFLATIFSLERPKYSFGRKWGRFLKSTVVQLPIQHHKDGSAVTTSAKKYHPEGYVPDWEYMEQFIRGLDSKPITTRNITPKLDLNPSSWEAFIFGDLIYDIHKAKANNREDLVEVPYTEKASPKNSIRYITRTASNNGCEMLVERDSALSLAVEKGNVITIGDTTATCSYQGKEFIAGDHMVVVEADWLNPFTGLFITTLLNAESYRYSYGRAFIMERIKNTELRLPIRCDETGNPVIDPAKNCHPEGFIPDWQLMENFIRSLPYGDRITETAG